MLNLAINNDWIAFANVCFMLLLPVQRLEHFKLRSCADEVATWALFRTG